MTSTLGGRFGAFAPAAQTRILIAALDLFAEHGVSGTSLQMIADALGVTKAAVYHQFKTNDEIIIAVTVPRRWCKPRCCRAQSEVPSSTRSSPASTTPRCGRTYSV